MTSDQTQSGMPGIENTMQEDMISNALVWLSSRLCNFIAAGEGFAPIPAGDRSESLQEDELGLYGKSQKSLLEKWNGFAREFEVWFQGLPATFCHLGTRPIIFERYFRPRVDPSTKYGIPMEWYIIYHYLSLIRGFNLVRGDLSRPSDLLLDLSFQAISKGLVLLFCLVCLSRKLNLCHAYDVLSLEILSVEQRCSTITWLGFFCSSTKRTRQPCVAVQLLIV